MWVGRVVLVTRLWAKKFSDIRRSWGSAGQDDGNWLQFERSSKYISGSKGALTKIVECFRAIGGIGWKLVQHYTVHLGRNRTEFGKRRGQRS